MSPSDSRSLADLTTLGVGGPPARLLTVTAESELVEAVRDVDRGAGQLLVVGGGSNLLVADAGLPGTALVVRTRGMAVTRVGDAWDVELAAGHPWDEAVTELAASGLAGVETLAGIPGCAGALPIQNVGAYGREIADVLGRVRVWDRRRERVSVLTPDELGLAYRDSCLKRDPTRAVVLSVTLRLRSGPDSDPVRYAELAGRLGIAVGDRAPVPAVRAAVLDLRRGKGMVLDPADADTRSAGSFFTNPLLEQAAAAGLPAEAPRFRQPDGRVKTSAAWLIERAGFAPGYAVRPGAAAALSGKHVLALTNRGGARATDILELARVIRDGVADRFGVVLRPEPVLVGCAL